jgi:hypothetical protein
MMTSTPAAPRAHDAASIAALILAILADIWIVPDAMTGKRVRYMGTEWHLRGNEYTVTGRDRFGRLLVLAPGMTEPDAYPYSMFDVIEDTPAPQEADSMARDYFSPQLAEGTYTAAKAGALALGRILAHAADLDGYAFPMPSTYAFARDAGFDAYCADLAVASYTDLLTGNGR